MGEMRTATNKQKKKKIRFCQQNTTNNWIDLVDEINKQMKIK